MSRPAIIIKSGKDQSLMRFHPWVFSGAIKKFKGQVHEGDLIDVFNNKDELLGTGHYQKSSIAVRMLSFNEGEIDHNFWRNRILNAIELRLEAGLFDSGITSVFRLINAEGDGMPGLIVDFYNGTAVMQAHSPGMFRIKEMLVEILKETLGKRLLAVYNKSGSSLPFKSEVKSEDGYLFGMETDHLVQEYGYNFSIDWEGGQKTGFFIDQRENRHLLKQYSQGRNVLNMFCYTGGFSVYALGGGAQLVHSVDASKKAINLTDRNIILNSGDKDKHRSFARDAFDFFNHPEAAYDLIILDPPAFAKHHQVLSNALQGYKKLNRSAFELIRPGGIIFTFSCSQVVSRENFRKSVFTAAANTGRRISILHQLSQPADHPVSIYHPEGEYLKGLVLKVE